SVVPKPCANLPRVTSSTANPDRCSAVTRISLGRTLVLFTVSLITDGATRRTPVTRCVRPPWSDGVSFRPGREGVRWMRPGGPVSPILAVVMASLLGLTGCGSDEPGSQVPTREPATAAPAPPTTVTPAGELFALPGRVDALLAESGTGLLAGLAADP